MLRKYCRAEKAAKVVSPEGHKAVQAELDKLSKTSAQQLSDKERQSVRLALEESDDTC